MTTTNLKKKIKEVNNYFVAKILAGEFEINEKLRDNYTLEIIVDGEFEFRMWMGFGSKSLDLSSGAMKLTFSEDEKTKIFDLLNKDFENSKLAGKRAEFEKLKAELEIN